MCSEATAEAALCEIDPVSAEATGACYYSICLQTCGTPEAPLGENGCDNPDLACYRARFFAGYLYYAEGRTEPDGICWVACTSDASCVESWGPGYTCDRDSGVCLR
jgi:hypothetical protein